MNTTSELLTIQQVSEITGLSVHTLRYYERIGLIYPIDRAQNTHRRYSSDDLGWIDFLLKLRATGMSIQDMQRYAELQCEGEHTLPERLEMMKAHRLKVEGQMRELQEHLDLICSKIGFYEEEIAAKNLN
ncbi:MAG TPA: MerR family transcriptional regulator [Phototrophicaceae bacterium]|nr:MerR family transcriptional regulator [Phototrophicaceae bacterium]